MSYEPTVESLSGHAVPNWFRDAKLGIFIHWGPYSIPAFAPKMGSITEIREKYPEDYRKYMPYSEWYLNTMRFKDSPTWDFHVKNYGDDYSYQNFGQQFNASLADWDPDAWADLFARSGAGYVVLVTKHHDGFLLWPSDVPNPHIPNWKASRDIVGELSAAVRARGLRFGVYYSGIDWTFRHFDMDNFMDLFRMIPGEAEGYIEYADAHYKELIDRYRPDYLWNDIAYPSREAALRIMAYYYNKIPDGIVNDRWIDPSEVTAASFANNEIIDAVMFPRPAHFDIRTPEYGLFDRVLPFDWETTRGMGHSFAYNRLETDADLASPDDLISTLAQSACFNGNFLLNIGPRGDAQVDLLQSRRLEAIGDWLSEYGESIKSTRPLVMPGSSIGDKMIGATQSRTNSYVFVFGRPDIGTIEFEAPAGLRAESATLLGGSIGETIAVDGRIKFASVQWSDSPVQVIKFANF